MVVVNVNSKFIYIIILLFVFCMMKYVSVNDVLEKDNKKVSENIIE